MVGKSLKGGGKKAGTDSRFNPVQMPEVSAWLSLRVLSKADSGNDSLRNSLIISIPKKIVRLATQRNRIKRLIREVFRKQTIFDRAMIYHFRVVRYPEDVTLQDVQDSVSYLMK